MKITGTSNDLSISFTASRPELPSASWMSARMMPGRLALASATASLWVRATPSTRCPRLSTRPSRSSAINVSSSMIRTSVAISAASSRPDSSTRSRNVGASTSSTLAASSSDMPSKATSRNAWRGFGGICARCRSTGWARVAVVDLPFSATEFQIFVNSLYSAILVERPLSSTWGSCTSASRVAAT